MGPNSYNPLRDPKLFSAVAEEGTDAIEECLAEMKSLMDRAIRGKASTGLQGQTHQVAAPMPEGQFRIERKVYQAFLEQCRNGDMTYLRLKNPISEKESNVVFFGANFDEDFPIKNLYKALNVIKPDALLV